MHRQPIPVMGISSDLEVAMEKCYNEHIMDTAAQGEEKGAPGEARCQTSPVFQAIQTEEHGMWGNHKDPSQETGPGPGLDPCPT